MEIEARIGVLLRKAGLTLAVAESCTGGYLGHLVTGIGRSLDYFAGGVIAYANEAKHRLLEVPENDLAEYGAVSEPVARAMAESVRRKLNADIGVAVTGIAGPGGGTAEKPVGLVFVAVADVRECIVRRLQLAGDRRTIKHLSSLTALEMIEDRLRAKED